MFIKSGQIGISAVNKASSWSLFIWFCCKIEPCSTHFGLFKVCFMLYKCYLQWMNACIWFFRVNAEGWPCREMTDNLNTIHPDRNPVTFSAVAKIVRKFKWTVSAADGRPSVSEEVNKSTKCNGSGSTSSKIIEEVRFHPCYIDIAKIWKCVDTNPKFTQNWVLLNRCFWSTFLWRWCDWIFIFDYVGWSVNALNWLTTGRKSRMVFNKTTNCFMHCHWVKRVGLKFSKLDVVASWNGLLNHLILRCSISVLKAC